MELGQTLSLSAEQLGMKVGMLMAAFFPIVGIFMVLYLKKHFAKRSTIQK